MGALCLLKILPSQTNESYSSGGILQIRDLKKLVLLLINSVIGTLFFGYYQLTSSIKNLVDTFSIEKRFAAEKVVKFDSVMEFWQQKNVKKPLAFRNFVLIFNSLENY